jgi:hypothetical protein
MHCILGGGARILIYMTYTPITANRESWQQPRYASMRALGSSLDREASG